MTAPWLSIVGIGEGGFGELTPVARGLITSADVIAGGRRNLAAVPDDGRTRIELRRPMGAKLDEIEGLRGRRVCVLATGDPMQYGIGATLARRVRAEEMTIVPSPSAYSLACARLGWPRGDVDCLTVHARPLERLHPFIQPGARLVILTDDGASPVGIAALLNGRGFGPSRMTVFERMGGTSERRLEAVAEEWPEADVDPLNTVAVDCVPGPDAAILSRVPGLPDDAFRHDGQLTKREVRAVTLAALAPGPGQLLWDVGAGCGSIAIEWMRIHLRARAVAIERVAARVDFIRHNATALGAPALEIVEGTAPEALKELDAPDAVFVGGGSSAEGMLETCWEALEPRGRLVANAVTVEGEQRLAAWQGRHGGELRRIAISRAGPAGSFNVWRALAPVTQLAAVKS